jgi:hypothetical protein
LLPLRSQRALIAYARVSGPVFLTLGWRSCDSKKDKSSSNACVLDLKTDTWLRRSWPGQSPNFPGRPLMKMRMSEHFAKMEAAISAQRAGLSGTEASSSSSLYRPKRNLQ